MSSIYPTPDLASVLRTLASYNTVQPTPPAAPAPAPAPPAVDEPEEEEYDPSSFNPSDSAPPSFNYPSQPSLPPQPPVPSDPAAQPSCLAPHPSSSSITTWPGALRHVMKTVVPDPTAAHRIRRLMATQHEHERQWWAGREALVLKQRGREEGRKRLDDVLASVGGLVNPLSHDSSPQTDLSELHLYDRKVHRACTAMTADSTSELARLGVPFFSIRPELVRRGGASTERRSESDTETWAEAGRTSREYGMEGEMLDEEELSALRRRMIALLEDLCAE